MRLFAPQGATPINLEQLAEAQRLRPGLLRIDNTPFIEQILGIGATGGPAMGPMTPDYAASWANFIGNMGTRYGGQQAQVFQQFAQGIGTPAAEPFQSIRMRAVAKLWRQLPGGILTIGPEGPDQRRLNLRTYTGYIQALEQAAASPQIQEAIAREAEVGGGGSRELADIMLWRTVFPQMSLSQATDFMRQREQTPGGFLGMGEKLPQPQQTAARIAGTDAVYALLQQMAAEREARFEQIAKPIFEQVTVSFRQVVNDMAQNLTNNMQPIIEMLTKTSQGVLDKSIEQDQLKALQSMDEVLRQQLGSPYDYRPQDVETFTESRNPRPLSSTQPQRVHP
jgi:hypothetical protein